LQSPLILSRLSKSVILSLYQNLVLKLSVYSRNTRVTSSCLVVQALYLSLELFALLENYKRLNKIRSYVNYLLCSCVTVLLFLILLLTEVAVVQR